MVKRATRAALGQSDHHGAKDAADTSGLQPEGLRGCSASALEMDELRDSEESWWSLGLWITAFRALPATHT